eukprot:TRINITY_DN1286_c0_g2_i4.p1 TRINITY_DN1286_c0_g2~~TRINITY_DN1286_c0_g2_i4.p1  ORF type:complete len:302 (+),score=67.01 TRINITY_DN1286_c0_g2_i4:155-1060(+)
MNEINAIIERGHAARRLSDPSRRRVFDSLPAFLQHGLFCHDRFINVKKQAFAQRMMVAELLKGEGNRVLSTLNVDLALRYYEQALSIFRYISNRKGNYLQDGIHDDDLDNVIFVSMIESENVKVKALCLSLYLHLAGCYLRKNDIKNTIAACDEALHIDPNNYKALYRRAKARISIDNPRLEHYLLSHEDLKKAASINPSDQVTQQEIVKVKKRLDELATAQLLNASIRSSESSFSSKPLVQDFKGPSRGIEDTRKKEMEASQEEFLDKLRNKSMDPFNYELSYEVNPNARIAPEVEELGR